MISVRTEVFDGVSPLLRRRPLPSRPFPIRHSSVTRSLDTALYVIPIASLTNYHTITHIFPFTSVTLVSKSQSWQCISPFIKFQPYFIPCFCLLLVEAPEDVILRDLTFPVGCSCQVLICYTALFGLQFQTFRRIVVLQGQAVGSKKHCMTLQMKALQFLETPGIVNPTTQR